MFPFQQNILKKTKKKTILKKDTKREMFSQMIVERHAFIINIGRYNMKKLLTVMLVLVMAFAFASCGGGSEGDGEGDGVSK